MTQPFGSGMPVVLDGKPIPIAPSIPTPANIEITPAIGEPLYQGQNPDFVADYIYCNTINVATGIQTPQTLNNVNIINGVTLNDGSPTLIVNQGWFNLHVVDPNWGNSDIWAFQGAWIVNNARQYAIWQLWASPDNPMNANGNHAELDFYCTTTSGGYASISYQRLGTLAGPNRPLWIRNTQGDIGIATGNVTGQPNWYFAGVTGMFYPDPTNAIDIGTTANKVRNLFVAGAVANRIKAGVPVDADVNTPTDGMLIVDTTNNKIMVRIGGVWKGVVVA
jgi:hypothetical protein